MSIRHTCTCGARIKLPDSAAGRKARCKSCGGIFRVPSADAETSTAGSNHPALTQPVPRPPAIPAGASQSDDPGSWLDDFARSESQAAGEPVELSRPLLDLADPEPEPRDGDEPRIPAHMAAVHNRDDGEWIAGPQRSFWAELGGTFLFFLDGGNLVTFVCLAVAAIVVEIVPLVGFFGMILSFAVSAYIAAFLLATVRESAGGEDELPAVWISSFWDDLFMPWLQFTGTWLFVLLPAIALTVISVITAGADLLDIFDPSSSSRLDTVLPWKTILALGAVGLFFWPAVVLAVAIGGTFSGLWPHTIIRTALGAPLGYLAICAALIVTAMLARLPDLLAAVGIAGKLPAMSRLALDVVSRGLGLYASIVAMQVIGLYYRHYKHRFPWVAE